MQNGTHRGKLDVERVRTLFANARFSIAGVFIGTFFFALFFWNNISHTVLFTWLAAIVVINFPRFLLVESFHREDRAGEITEEGVLDWERRFYLGVLLSAISWGAVSLFPYQADIGQSLLFATLLLIAMSSASIVTLITSLKMGLTFLTVTIIPLILRALWEGGEHFLILAGSTFAYYLVFTRMAQRLHATVIDNIHLRLENEELSLTDTLTGLWNRRQLYLFVDQLQLQVERSGEVFSIILLDLDHFKRFNDSRGHNAGDELLVKVAGIICSESRQEDLSVRYGGEEFLVVLPRAAMDEAAEVAERIRLGVSGNTPVTISAGIAEFHGGCDFDTLLGRADEALYHAKAQGRDRVISYDALPQERR